jgi:GntR family transcriptional regulator, colanic acid and biofilm gene transcriptional regulator
MTASRRPQVTHARARRPAHAEPASGEGAAIRIEPLDQGNLSVRTYVALKDALIAGAFRPGQRLLMQELADRLGTSVTPVREACMRLVSERGLEVRSGRFVTVPELTLARYMEIRTIRIELEGLAAERAARYVTADDLVRIEDVQARFALADRQHDSEAAIRLNREFHFMVYRRSAMEMLVAHIESLWISMGPILNVYYNEIANDYTGAEEHLHLIEALRARDARRARAAIRMDILRGGESLLRYLDGRQAEVGT